MSWTAKAILGLMIILAVWVFGFFGVDFLVSRQFHHHSENAGWQLVAIVITYILAGPVSGVLWVWWARRKAAAEHEEGTRDRIGALRVTVRR